MYTLFSGDARPLHAFVGGDGESWLQVRAHADLSKDDVVPVEFGQINGYPSWRTSSAWSAAELQIGGVVMEDIQSGEFGRVQIWGLARDAQFAASAVREGGLTLAGTSIGIGSHSIDRWGRVLVSDSSSRQVLDVILEAKRFLTSTFFGQCPTSIAHDDSIISGSEHPTKALYADGFGRYFIFARHTAAIPAGEIVLLEKSANGWFIDSGTSVASDNAVISYGVMPYAVEAASGGDHAPVYVAGRFDNLTVPTAVAITDTSRGIEAPTSGSTYDSGPENGERVFAIVSENASSSTVHNGVALLGRIIQVGDVTV